MSLTRLVFPQLGWDEFLYLLSFLSIKDIYLHIGHLNRSGWLTFLRERILRSSSQSQSQSSIPSSSSSSLNSRTIQSLLPSSTIPILLPKLGPAHDRVVLVSYPRSGNSMLRQLLEARTGIITGSDSRTNRTLTSELLRCGYLGEGITDKSVWIVKSHYPERLGYIKLPIDRIILLVRNPYDCITSYFHMGMTNTHDKNLSLEVFTSLQEIFHDFVDNEGHVWNDFHDFWYLLSEKLDIPMLTVRYEDLIQHQEATMNDIIEFLVKGNIPQIYGLRLKQESRLCQHSISSVIEPRYGLKKGGIGKSLEVLKSEDIENISSITQIYRHFIGYKVQSKCYDHHSNNYDDHSNADNSCHPFYLELAERKPLTSISMPIERQQYCKEKTKEFIQRNVESGFFRVNDTLMYDQMKINMVEI